MVEGDVSYENQNHCNNCRWQGVGNSLSQSRTGSYGELRSRWWDDAAAAVAAAASRAHAISSTYYLGYYDGGLLGYPA